MGPFLAAVAGRYRASALPSAQEAAAELDRLTAAPCPLGETALELPELDRALEDPGRHPLADLARPFAHRLPWKTGDDQLTMPSGFAGRYRFCEIVGPDGLIPHQTIRFGAYLQYAGIYYPLHSHEAEELYLPICGTARWWRDGVEGRFETPGTLIRHASYERHATETAASPLLALWAWTGGIDIGSYRIDGID
ncbi:hypothetical protein KHP62_18610 [Rhodobacteraceae bacterium NNCM2]|nr:hypothetical protein [Coraliihabitans acroporae]